MPLLIATSFVASLASAQEWTALTALPEPRFEMASAEVDGRLYLFGGFGAGAVETVRCDVFDPATGAWSRLADLPSATTHLNAVVDGRTIWLPGGFEQGERPAAATAAVWRYDVDTNSYEAGPALPEPRGGGGAAIVDRRLHYFGGLLGDRNTDSEAHWVLDLDAASTGWREAAPMPEPRNQFGVAVLEGRIWAIGGQFHHDRTLREPQDQTLVHVYDPRTDQWSAGPSLPHPTSHIEPATFVDEGRIVIAAGRGGGSYRDEVLALDPGAGRWEHVTDLPHALLAPAARRLGGRLVVVSGSPEGYVPVPEVWGR